MDDTWYSIFKTENRYANQSYVFKIFQMSHGVPYFGRDYKMLYEKPSDYKNRVTLWEFRLRRFLHSGLARKMNTYLPQFLILKTDFLIKFLGYAILVHSV